MISPIKLWRRQKYIPELLKQKGEIISWTVVRTPPKGLKQFAPYAAALIELSTGEKIAGQIVDCDISQLKIGTKVVAVLRKVRSSGNEGVIPYGIKFRCIRDKV